MPDEQKMTGELGELGRKQDGMCQSRYPQAENEKRLKVMPETAPMRISGRRRSPQIYDPTVADRSRRMLGARLPAGKGVRDRCHEDFVQWLAYYRAGGLPAWTLSSVVDGCCGISTMYFSTSRKNGVTLHSISH